MSIKLVENRVREFIHSKTPEVIAIYGKWGVGKTYFWQELLKKEKKSIAYKKYSYVSLFGINTLEALKYAIFENMVSVDKISKVVGIESFKLSTDGISRQFVKRGFKHLSSLFTSYNASPLFENVAYLSINEILICIDDLERRGKALDVRDILGLITQMKEQKKCKIALIINSKEEENDDYAKYREKAIDYEYHYDPSPEEAAKIAFPGGDFVDIELRKASVALGIRNIRVLKKNQKLIKTACKITSDCEKELYQQIIHSLTLFSWCYHCSKGDPDIPSLEYTIGSEYDPYGLNTDKSPESEKQALWSTILRGYKFYYMDELDVLLVDVVKIGYLPNGFNDATEKRNEQLVASNSDASFTTAWGQYHDSFKNNQDEVVEGLYSSFIQNAQYISPTNLECTVNLFREFGEIKRATEMIDHYINVPRGNPHIFDFTDTSAFRVKDEEIIAKFKIHYEKLRAVPDIREVLRNIAGKNGWNPEDEDVLANATVDEYYELFTNIGDDALSSFIHTCLKFGKFNNASDQHKEISRNATTALKKISSESKINELRIRQYGIK